MYVKRTKVRMYEHVGINYRACDGWRYTRACDGWRHVVGWRYTGVCVGWRRARGVMVGGTPGCVMV